jgi:ribokinase
VMDADMHVRYAQPDDVDEPAEVTAERDRVLTVDPARVITSLLAVDEDGTAVGHIAVRHFTNVDGAAEVELKRLIVTAAARGKGAATALLDECAAVGREVGAERLILQTGDKQPEAVALYEKTGWTRIPIYGEYAATIPRSLCFEKRLCARPGHAEPVSERIVVVGSLNADLIVRTPRFPRPGETLRGGDLAVMPGGKSANQAVAIGRLGGDVAMIGAVGDDPHGELLLGGLGGAGVDVERVRVIDDVATGTAVITVADGGENTIVISAGANGRLAPDDIVAVGEVLEDAAVVCLCLEVGSDVLLAAARRSSGTVVLNLSPYGDVPAELLERTDVLLVNEHEAAQLVGADIGDARWELLPGLLADRGISRAVVTTGADGCIVLDAGSPPERIASVPVHAVDTTGCGDAFAGAIALQLAAGHGLADAARFAVGVGAFAATRPGAQASYPTPDELAAFVSAPRP